MWRTNRRYTGDSISPTTANMLRENDTMINMQVDESLQDNLRYWGVKLR